MRTRSTWMMYVLLVAVALVFVGPFLILLSTALKPPGQAVYSFPPNLLPIPPVTTWLEHAWTNIPFPRYLLNSAFYVVVMVPVSLLISALAAYPLARMRFRGRQLVFGLFLGTMFLPAELMLVPLFLVVSQLHLTNTYAGVMMPGLFGAFQIFLLRQAFAGVPQDLVDAARIDGAGELRIWWHVMVPQAAPAFATLAIFGFISVWNSFVWPLVVLNDSDKYPTALGLAYLNGIFGVDVRTLAAGTVIALVPIVVFFLLMQRHFLEGMKGALKG
ncbi:MAG TPA: carbohydrate ABC transporter permease [Actinopolymorphaceae bacterium]|nr:carbohydrate ABC transporter permease [Actinopolymorphaceae bacterium]